MSLLRSLWDGARLRCPACRTGRLFASYNRLHARCPACGVAFEASPGEFTGAMMFAQGFFGVLGLMGWFVLAFVARVPPWAAIAWLVLAGLVAPVLLYRNFKGAWIGAMHAFGGLEPPGPNTRP